MNCGHTPPSTETMRYARISCMYMYVHVHVHVPVVSWGIGMVLLSQLRIYTCRDGFIMILEWFYYDIL